MIAKLTGEAYKNRGFWEHGSIVEIVRISRGIWYIRKDGQMIGLHVDNKRWKITILSFNDYIKLIQ